MLQQHQKIYVENVSECKSIHRTEGINAMATVLADIEARVKYLTVIYY